MTMKKLLYVQPSATNKYNDMVQDSLDRYTDSGFKAVVRNIEYGGDVPSCKYYACVSVPYMIEEILKGEKEGYSGVIIGCFGDPGIDEAREVVSIPVVGIGAAACHIACLLGDEISIITTGDGVQHKNLKLNEKYHHQFYKEIRRKLQLQGLLDRVVSIRTYMSSVDENAAPADEGIADVDALLEQGRKAIEEDGADVLVLGCAFMMGVADKLQEFLGVPVVDSTLAAVKVTEMLISMNLKHSVLAYPFNNVGAEKTSILYPPTLKGYHGNQV